MNTERVWPYETDVLFNDVAYNSLILSKFEFVPAEVKKMLVEVPGASGAIDMSEAINGYPVYNGIKAKIELTVRHPAQWVCWRETAAGGTEEADFLQDVNGKMCEIRFRNTNDFYLRGRPKISNYDKYGMIWKITLDVECDPYWWEQGLAEAEWQIDYGATNLIDPSGVTPTVVGSDTTCVYSSLRGGYVLRAQYGYSATAHFVGLQASQTYRFSCRVIQGGRWELWANGEQIADPSHITGVTDLYFTMISDTQFYAACVFLDIALYSDNVVEQIGIRTLDNPLRSVNCYASANCRIVLGGEAYDIPAGNTVLHGLNIPPNTLVLGSVTAPTTCHGSLMYQRGRFSCTL